MVLGIGRVQMHAVCRRDVPEFLGTVFVCTRVRWELCEINRGGGTDGVSDGVVLGIGCDRVLALRRRDRRGDHRLIIVIDGGRRKLRELDWCVGGNKVPRRDCFRLGCERVYAVSRWHVRWQRGLDRMYTVQRRFFCELDRRVR